MATGGILFSAAAPLERTPPQPVVEIGGDGMDTDGPWNGKEDNRECGAPFFMLAQIQQGEQVEFFSVPLPDPASVDADSPVAKNAAMALSAEPIGFLEGNLFTGDEF